jgi:hypothetical protein
MGWHKKAIRTIDGLGFEILHYTHLPASNLIVCSKVIE